MKKGTNWTIFCIPIGDTMSIWKAKVLSLTVKIINANPYGLLSQQELGVFEKGISIELPDDYRSFLLNYNGGKPVPSFFWIQPDEDGDSICQFYGLHDGPQHLRIDKSQGNNDYGIPDLLIPIGDDGLGNFICIGVTKSIYGEIYFLDHEEHFFDDPNSFQGIIKISNSFSDFINSLTERPDQ